MSSKKIYFIRQKDSKFGGAETYLSRLCTELKMLDIDYEIIHSKAPKFLSSFIKALLFNVQICLNKKDRFYFSLDRVSCPDIYRAGDGVHKTFLQIKKRKFNPLNIVYLFLEKRAFNRAKKIIAISNMVKQNIIDAYDISPKKIEVIQNGIKLIKVFDKDITEAKQKIYDEFHLAKDIPIILYVGSGFERKGVKEFLEIISKLNHQYHAFIVGKEKKINTYKELAKTLNISKNVTFTGSRTDVNNFYLVSDIFLFPTHYEPFGNVILEAMNFQNAVVTTKQCGGGELLDEKYLMSSPKDIKIYKLIDKLLFDKQKLENIKKENYKIVQNFSIEKNVEKTLRVIDEVID